VIFSGKAVQILFSTVKQLRSQSELDSIGLLLCFYTIHTDIDPSILYPFDQTAHTGLRVILIVLVMKILSEWSLIKIQQGNNPNKIVYWFSLFFGKARKFQKMTTNLWKRTPGTAPVSVNTLCSVTPILLSIHNRKDFRRGVDQPERSLFEERNRIRMPSTDPVQATQRQGR